MWNLKRKALCRAGVSLMSLDYRQWKSQCRDGVSLFVHFEFQNINTFDFVLFIYSYMEMNGQNIGRDNTVILRFHDHYFQLNNQYRLHMHVHLKFFIVYEQKSILE